MSKKIVLRVYQEERFTGEKKLMYSDVIVTEITASEIIDFLQVDDGFSVCIVEGNVLSFLDFSCIAVQADKVVSRLKEVPVAEETPETYLPGRCILSVTEECNEAPLVRPGQELVYICNRVECGASGFEETVIAWAAGHPIAMIFIGGLLWDWTKELWHKIKCRLGFRSTNTEGAAPIAFSPKKFHKNLSQLLNLGRNDFQIIKIGRVKRGEHKVLIRIIKNETYEVTADTNGKIISANLKP